uniref:Uncharacterized protein n=1 Tax=Rhizophora mucronata TaxID=61149 RepID=A0A2P2QKT9_RHIMU
MHITHQTEAHHHIYKKKLKSTISFPKLSLPKKLGKTARAKTNQQREKRKRKNVSHRQRDEM